MVGTKVKVFSYQKGETVQEYEARADKFITVHNVQNVIPFGAGSVLIWYS